METRAYQTTAWYLSQDSLVDYTANPWGWTPVEEGVPFQARGVIVISMNMPRAGYMHRCKYCIPLPGFAVLCQLQLAARHMPSIRTPTEL